MDKVYLKGRAKSARWGIFLNGPVVPQKPGTTAPYEHSQEKRIRGQQAVVKERASACRVRVRRQREWGQQRSSSAAASAAAASRPAGQRGVQAGQHTRQQLGSQQAGSARITDARRAGRAQRQRAG